MAIINSKSKLIWLYGQSKPLLVEAQEQAEEMQTEPDYQVLFETSFLMGVVSGVILEKRPDEKPQDLKRIAENYINEVFEE